MSNQLTMTASQALAEGYTHWGYDNGSADFRRLSEIKEFTNNHLRDAINYEYGTPVLAQKEPYYMAITASDLRDMIADHIHSLDSFKDDDPNTIPDALAEVEGLQSFVEKINSKLREHPYWYLTQIQLIPDENPELLTGRRNNHDS